MNSISDFSDLSARLTQAETRYLHAEKRFRLLCGTLLGATTLVISLPFVSPVVAQGYGITLAQAATRIAALETKTASMSVLSATDPSNTSGYQTVRFTGVNLQVVNGAGSTNTVNGGGNLIVGYNELRNNTSPDVRTGSHIIVAGFYNNYATYGAAVIGFNNDISNDQACVFGGYDNKASGLGSVVSGGHSNTASGQASCITGGYTNAASGESSSITGGTLNVADGIYCSVSGGDRNTASGNSSSVSGGQRNRADGAAGSATGGFHNLTRATSFYCTVSGGKDNTTDASNASVSGGIGNNAATSNSSVSGGDNLTAPTTGSNGGQNAPWCAGGGPGGNGVYRAPN